MSQSRRIFVLVVLGATGLAPLFGQVNSSASQANQCPLPPATKLEASTPSAGSLFTIGYERLGTVSGVAIETREVRDAKGLPVRGLLVDVTESASRREHSFVDEDEIPGLLKGFDALLEIQTNPTLFKHFEVRYTTRGELQLTAFNDPSGSTKFSVRAGRMQEAVATGLSISDMRRIRDLFDQAEQKLAALAAPK